MRKILLNAFQNRKRIIEILKRKAIEHQLDENWVLSNWWIEDIEGRDFFILRIGKPSDDILAAHILPHDVIEL